MHSLSTSEFQIEYIFKFYSELLTVIIYKTEYKAVPPLNVIDHVIYTQNKL